MFFSSPTSNITPALVSVAMTRTDSRDSNTSTFSYTSTPSMQVCYSTSPIYNSFSSRGAAMSISSSTTGSSTGWLPSPYRSCMLHSSSSQGYTPVSAPSSYISDDDLLALDNLAMPPIEYVSSPTSAPRQVQAKRELTTEEQIALLREQQEQEQEQGLKSRAQQQQRTVRFAAEQRKTTTRRVSAASGASQRRGTSSSARRV